MHVEAQRSRLAALRSVLGRIVRWAFLCSKIWRACGLCWQNLWVVSAESQATRSNVYSEMGMKNAPPAHCAETAIMEFTDATLHLMRIKLCGIRGKPSRGRSDRCLPFSSALKGSVSKPMPSCMLSRIVCSASQQMAASVLPTVGSVSAERFCSCNSGRSKYCCTLVLLSLSFTVPGADSGSEFLDVAEDAVVRLFEAFDEDNDG